MDRIRVSAPATIANLGPGFDVFGLALGEPRDVVEVERVSEGVVISHIEGLWSNRIPMEPEKNTAGLAALRMLQTIRADFGVSIKIVKGIRPLSGLGSSAASAAAAVFGMDILAGEGLSKEEMIEIAAKGEEASAGFAHVDNVAPSILGGFTMVRSYSPLSIEKIEPPRFTIVIVTPDITFTTREARNVLPSNIELRRMVSQIGSCSGLIAGMMKGDLTLIGECINRDYVVEPRRAPLVPGFDRVKRAALDAGAYGCSLSGAGPSVFAICEDAQQVAKAMVDEFVEQGVQAESMITSPSSIGCRVVR